MATLGHERAGVISLAARTEREVRTRVEALLRDADPVRRDELVRRWIDARLLGLLGLRSLAGLDTGREPGPEHSVIKLAWSRVGTDAARSAVNAAGADGMLATCAAVQPFISSPAKGIAAGTTEIMKNILAERVLGLPR
jgi:alkylation response protein AidB-like acyl-CoA dehydrogenase